MSAKDYYKFKLHCQNLVSLADSQRSSKVIQVVFVKILSLRNRFYLFYEEHCFGETAIVIMN